MYSIINFNNVISRSMRTLHLDASNADKFLQLILCDFQYGIAHDEPRHRIWIGMFGIFFAMFLQCSRRLADFRIVVQWISEDIVVFIFINIGANRVGRIVIIFIRIWKFK